MVDYRGVCITCGTSLQQMQFEWVINRNSSVFEKLIEVLERVEKKIDNMTRINSEEE